MKIKTLFCIVILVSAAVVANARTIALPAECAKMLDQKYKGWKFADIGDDVIQWFLESKQPYRPNLLKGDWNGDKRVDYAALIQKTDAVSPESGIVLTVFMKKVAGGYRLYQLEGNDYIVYIKKGVRDYDYETNRNFTYRHDAIFTGFFEKAGISYVWRKGKFVAITTSD